MEDWKVLYASKLMTADEAVRQIPDGSRVFFGHAANEPPVLVDALVRNYEQYKDVEIVHWVPMGKGEYCDPKMKGHLRHNAMFVGGPTRKAVQEGRADYTPFFFHQSTRFFSDGTFPIDVAMVSVTPPDKHGYVSLGVSVGGTKPACLNAKMVIAQVNDQMPRTMGESFLHVSQLTCCVEASTPLPELGGGTIGEVEEAIGRNVASLVEDGSTLQLGIGTIPDAVLKFLGDKKDLGIHSEMFSDGVVDLYQIRQAMEQAPENVTFAGFVDRETLREAYCGADVFAFMSHEETEGIVVLEALACGIPTVVRDIPVYNGWLREGQNVYKASGTDEFQQKAEGLLTGTLPDLTAAGRRVAEERSLSVMGERLREVYRRMDILPAAQPAAKTNLPQAERPVQHSFTP